MISPGSGAEPQVGAASLLDTAFTSARSEATVKIDHARSARSRRCFQRAISGIQLGGPLRLLTLTTAPSVDKPIQSSFRALVMRLRRRNLLTDYFKVREFTKAGRPHLHVLFRGRYIPQPLVSKWWAEIHGSSVVDIRTVKGANMARYLSKYMSKDERARYSWSWGWVWRGFSKDWADHKRLLERFRAPMWQVINLWTLRLWTEGRRRGLEPVVT